MVLAILVIALWPLAVEPDREKAAPDDVAARPEPAPDPIPTSPEEREALPPVVQRYLESTVYPPGTGRLAADQNDLIHPNERYEDFRRVIDTFSTNPDEVVSIRLTADRFFYTEDQTVRLDLRVRLGAEAIEPISVQASAIREGRAGVEGDPRTIRFHREADALVAELDTAPFADHHGSIVVNARIEYQPTKFHDETLRFFYTPPGKIPARFTGEVRDELANGHLRIGVGLDVDQSGFYRLDANLYDRFGQPVSFSSFKGNLTAGKRFVPIDFFGRTIRDAGGTGPFIVGEIRGYRFLDGQYPDRERIPDFAGRFTTAAYENRRFSDDEYTSEHKQQMVKLLLEDVANGLSIDAPPLPTDSSAVVGDAPTE